VFHFASVGIPFFALAGVSTLLVCLFRKSLSVPSFGLLTNDTGGSTLWKNLSIAKNQKKVIELVSMTFSGGSLLFSTISFNINSDRTYTQK
jgi:hypothetical protein